MCCCVLCVQVCVRWHAAGRYQISNTALNSAGPALICNGGCAGVSGHLRFFILTARWPQQEVPLGLDENAPPLLPQRCLAHLTGAAMWQGMTLSKRQSSQMESTQSQTERGTW